MWTNFTTKANKALGTRVRKTLQEIKTLASDIRKEIGNKEQRQKINRWSPESSLFSLMIILNYYTKLGSGLL